MFNEGIVYNSFRDYDPATGRYVESDPVQNIFIEGMNKKLFGDLDGVTRFTIVPDNLYTYACVSPLLNYDSYGLYTQNNKCDVRDNCKKMIKNVRNNFGRIIILVVCYLNDKRPPEPPPKPPVPTLPRPSDPKK